MNTGNYIAAPMNQGHRRAASEDFVLWYTFSLRVRHSTTWYSWVF